MNPNAAEVPPIEDDAPPSTEPSGRSLRRKRWLLHHSSRSATPANDNDAPPSVTCPITLPSAALEPGQSVEQLINDLRRIEEAIQHFVDDAVASQPARISARRKASYFDSLACPAAPSSITRCQSGIECSAFVVLASSVARRLSRKTSRDDAEGSQLAAVCSEMARTIQRACLIGIAGPRSLRPWLSALEGAAHRLAHTMPTRGDAEVAALYERVQVPFCELFNRREAEQRLAELDEAW